MEGFFNFGPGDTLDNNDSPFSNEGARGAANSSQSQQKGGCPAGAAGGGGSSTGAPHTPQTPSSIPDIILTGNGVIHKLRRGASRNQKSSRKKHARLYK